jgi:hypothetical protein
MCELNYYVILLFLLVFSLELLKVFESDLLVSEVYLVDVVGTPKVEPTRVMNFCAFNHNTYLSLLDIGNFFKLVFGFDYQICSERN